MKRSRVRYILRTFFWCFAGLLLSLYILLSSGFLGEVPGRIVGEFVSGEDLTLNFRGLRTDVFWNTSADSVIVTYTDGMSIILTDVRIAGSLPWYLVTNHVREIFVDGLGIHLPFSAQPDTSRPDPLRTVLDDIDTGIAASADRLVLNYGILTDGGTVIVDSMHIDASVQRGYGVTVNVDSAGVAIPGFGGIGGSGTLMMADGDVTTDAFTAFAAPGSLTVAGILSGDDEKINVRISGGAGTASLHLPVELSFLFQGTLAGPLSEMKSDLNIYDGDATLMGQRTSFQVDTLTLDLGGLDLVNLIAVTDNAQLQLSGAFDFGSLQWNSRFMLALSGADLSKYLQGLPLTNLNGSVTGQLSGRGSGDLGGWIDVALESSTSEVLDVSNVDVQASLQGSEVHAEGSVSNSSGLVSFTASGNLGTDWSPVSWSLQANGHIDDFAFLDQMDITEIPQVASAWFSLSGTGTRFGMSLRGDAGLRQCDYSGLRVDAVTFSGSMDYSSRGAVAGIPAGLSMNGTLEVEGLVSDAVSADTTLLEGNLRLSGSRSEASASVRVDSLRFLSQSLHAEAEVELDGNNATVNGLYLSGSGDRSYSADLTVSLGDTLRVRVEDINATHSKLRVITQGYMLAYIAGERFVLDTLWLDPPVGELSVSGFMEGGETSLRADIDDFDFSSFSTYSGLPARMSGIGDLSVSYDVDSSGLRGSVTGKITAPAYGQFNMDSITVDIEAQGNTLYVNGIYAWHDGVRSGLQMRASQPGSRGEQTMLHDRIEWLELEVNDISDWLFYVLPLPIRTMGASVSARVEYERYDGDYDFEMQASARISRLYITLLGIELPNVNFYLNYPDTTEDGYNARFTLGSGSIETGNFSSQWNADIRSIVPFELGGYSISADLSEMEISIPGMGAVLCTGHISTQGRGLGDRPTLAGKIRILEGAVGVPQPVSVSQGGGSGELPFDLSIDVSGTGDLWFRTSFADIELSLKLRIFTLERKPTVNGYVSAVRGSITLLQRDFQIVQGTVNIIQGNPPTMQLNVTAETTVRSAISHQEYVITVHITGDAEHPEINLTGIGPAGQIAQEDVLTLLAVGLTYSEMQQLNSSAIRSEVESVAQTMLGSLLARNLRHEIGLDTFEISPELLSDTTSLVLNVGKYVLPDLYVSYKDDVFSGDPGTVSAQYLFSNDFYIEGTSRTTIHGYLEPTLELHYTFRY